jgi:hypothetical protein
MPFHLRNVVRADDLHGVRRSYIILTITGVYTWASDASEPVLVALAFRFTGQYEGMSPNDRRGHASC